MSETKHIEIKIKLNHPNAIMPHYAYETDGCIDLYAADVINGELFIEYNTGLNILIPEDYVGLLFPRSSVTNKTLILKNSVGVIDPGYVGDIKFRYYITPTDNGIVDTYNIGERVGQLMIIERPKINLTEVNSFEKTERGIGGYGSTGQ